MTARRHRSDRGLAAVERVRGVREQDSRIGLQQALAEERDVNARLDHCEDRLAATAWPQVSTPAELIGLGTYLGMVGHLITETRADAATALALAADARARWTTDKARLSAVEHLLERRADARQAEADRRTAAELDDLAAQRWQRTHDTGSHA